MMQALGSLGPHLAERMLGGRNEDVMRYKSMNKEISKLR